MTQDTIRSPIISVLGHVDHGKTSVLDRIRGTDVAAGEPGAITQCIGASFIPTRVVEKRCGLLLEKYKFDLKIPGLLMVDTPGHEAFTNLRKRGGSVADLAVLVVDVSQGFQPQTVESLEILKRSKTPFIVAANKIDTINGWISKPDASFAETLEAQRDFVQRALDEKLYELVGRLGEMGFNSERFDRVTDLTKNVLIVPVSAKTGEGFPELLLFLAGLAQKFMEKKLHVDLDAPAIGTVLEVKKTEGLGPSVDAIIYEGSISAGDQVAVATTDGPIITKVRALLQPAPLEEIRDPKKKFKSVEKVSAAAGVKVAAPGLENAISGSPLFVVLPGKENELIERVRSEIEAAVIETEAAGVIVKTDALGSLEAIANLFAKEGIKIRRAGIGGLTKRDVLEAKSVRSENRYLGAVFVFNSDALAELKQEAERDDVPVFSSSVVYSLIDDYKRWKTEEQKLEKDEQLVRYVFPAKMKIIPGNVFRLSKPAVVGVEMLGGAIKPKYRLINEKGEETGVVESIQSEKQTLDKLEAGSKAAIAIGGGTVGRNLKEGMILYSDVPREQLYELLDRTTSEDERKLIKEIMRIKEEKK